MEKHSNLNKIQNLSERNELVENFKNEIAKLSVKSLNNQIKKLNFLCLELDPYNAIDLSQEEENILNEFSLKSFLSNPFDFTNIILQLLDSAETELKTRSH